jgi:UDP-N-acetylglucosamine--N-acetylmuramyl-(pentapeptide) pyrophosphoryl-undecaprenol N-acetylglucosamine transferase
VSAVGLPGVYVPLPHGNGEQELNARPVVDAGGGVLIKDGELTAELVAEVLVPLLSDSERLRRMGMAAAGAGHRSAAAEIATIVLEVAMSERSDVGIRP